MRALRTVKDLEDFQNSLSLLKAITNEQKAYLDEKYALSKIKRDSYEYGHAGNKYPFHNHFYWRTAKVESFFYVLETIYQKNIS